MANDDSMPLFGFINEPSQCSRCGGLNYTDGKTCSKCKEIGRRSVRKRVAKKKQQGLCIECSEPLGESTTLRCRKCSEEIYTRERLRWANRLASGLCGRCGGEKEDGGLTICLSCRQAASEWNKDRTNKYKSKGMCSQCGKPSVPKRTKCQECLDKWLVRNEQYKPRRRPMANAARRKNRLAVLAAYGNQCACCGLDITVFLDMDHIDGNGNKHRKTIKRPLVDWLYQNNFPKGLVQILCKNCNWGKYIYGKCPHQLMREGLWPPKELPD